MKRGELYLVERATKNDTKKQRVYVVVSRQPLLDSSYSTVICAPVYSTTEGIETQVTIGTECGLKHFSCIRCDELISVRKSDLTNYVGTLPFNKINELNRAIRIALAIVPILSR
ncbi:MAG: type II toxin-antitoxin system PemK/MazF family toxin [Treponema sp.]|nr:type II toxin-antitoxin system PemK/MazF family toxin [Treponema sp.]